MVWEEDTGAPFAQLRGAWQRWMSEAAYVLPYSTATLAVECFTFKNFQFSFNQRTTLSYSFFVPSHF